MSIWQWPFAQLEDVAPSIMLNKITDESRPKALFDIQWQVNIGESLSPGAVNRNHNGIAWTGAEFWISRWDSDTLWTADINGNPIDKFVIPGVSDVRSITYDGNLLYMGSAGPAINIVDPASKTWINAVTMEGGNVGARMCAFDPMADNGNGGFWIANFTSDIQLISTNGFILNSIPFSTHGVEGIYGGAVDSFHSDGPFLWVYAQPEVPSDNMLYQLELPGLTQTGVWYDVAPDVIDTAALAGGAFITDGLVPGKVTLVTCTQDTDDGSQLTAYDITEAAIGIEENTKATLRLQPNPASDKLIVSSKNSENGVLQIYDQRGRVVLGSQLRSGKASVSIASLPPGVYLVVANIANSILRQRLVVVD